MTLLGDLKSSQAGLLGRGANTSPSGSYMMDLVGAYFDPMYSGSHQFFYRPSVGGQLHARPGRGVPIGPPGHGVMEALLSNPGLMKQAGLTPRKLKDASSSVHAIFKPYY
ncbi:hypothetical protein [Bauldia sp.]|uniref:hypothetical protein n=1 Tax=Bauldia sp. TaxID=2575872 RepID=UPI003BAB29DB